MNCTVPVPAAKLVGLKFLATWISPLVADTVLTVRLPCATSVPLPTANVPVPVMSPRTVRV